MSDESNTARMAEDPVELRMRVAREFADWLREELGDVVLDVRVFGSTARGDVHESQTWTCSSLSRGLFRWTKNSRLPGSPSIC